MPQEVIQYAPPQALLASPEDVLAIKEAYAINLAGGSISQFDLPRIKIMTGAALWLIPSLEREETAPRIEGVIVFARDARVYFKDKDAKRPDCSSADGVTGVGSPGGECAACPLAEFGSAQDGSGGQACKQIKQLFMVRGASMFPEIVSLPPTSLKNARQFLLKLTTSGIPYYRALIAVELEKAENAQKKPYGKAVFKFLRRLTPEEVERAMEYHQMCQEFAGRVATAAAFEAAAEAEAADAAPQQEA
ncbi:MAG: hypothetical protein KIT09_28045 [Bryobacteraceae bacterium]|nr:hypothetical protein [Bryobacteraceae bacterium]